jgi:signal transduction histidine kinase
MFADYVPSHVVAEWENRLHAVRSALAGLSGGLHVLVDNDDELSAASRQRMECMLVAEVERLQRLVAPHVSDEVSDGEDEREVSGELDVDHLVGGVVMARRLAGQEIAWSPTGCRVPGRADALTEVLNILTVNAWRHAQGAPARIDVVHEADAVSICVSDNGPGVPDELSDSIFERGVRRPGSSGQGLGLAMARSLVEELGGTLSLVPATSGGACFKVSLPVARQDAA